ncbi:MAG: DNA-binding protein [Nitrosomonadales bacterium]|nr:DNA-binding protein [Nitrosomonadales bacterium]
MAERLIARGIANNIAAETGTEVADDIASHWGGQNVYFPFDMAARRNAQIYAKFTGDNHDKLAMEFNVSVQHIYRVLKIMLTAEKASRQPGLFPD